MIPCRQKTRNTDLQISKFVKIDRSQSKFDLSLRSNRTRDVTLAYVNAPAAGMQKRWWRSKKKNSQFLQSPLHQWFGQFIDRFQFVKSKVVSRPHAT